MSRSEQQFFDAVAARGQVRPSVRAIIPSGDGSRILVQRPADSPPGSSYAFPGGGYEYGDTLHERLAQEIEEETNARLVSWEYLFTLEHRFLAGGKRIHGLELYCLATIDRDDVVSRESHLVLHPAKVRDLVATNRLHEARHILVDDWA
jgi:8-oxo-dGTP pyrophosphatase MutT (NUDIX family)